MIHPVRQNDNVRVQRLAVYIITRLFRIVQFNSSALVCTVRVVMEDRSGMIAEASIYCVVHVLAVGKNQGVRHEEIWVKFP